MQITATDTADTAHSRADSSFRGKRIAFGTCVGYTFLVWLPWTFVGLGCQLPIATATNALGRWPITHLLRLPEPYVPSGGASNPLPTSVMAVSGAIISVAGAALWVLIDRSSRNCARAFAWLPVRSS